MRTLWRENAMMAMIENTCVEVREGGQKREEREKK
jgi:hypothetical protein